MVQEEAGGQPAQHLGAFLAEQDDRHADDLEQAARMWHEERVLAAVGAAAGGLTGALVGLGIPEYEAKQYEGKILKGNILISVHTETSDEVDRAKEILKREGAEDISYTGEASVKAA